MIIFGHIKLNKLCFQGLGCSAVAEHLSRMYKSPGLDFQYWKKKKRRRRKRKKRRKKIINSM
jgi:hypothetical protein